LAFPGSKGRRLCAGLLAFAIAPVGCGWSSGNRLKEATNPTRPSRAATELSLMDGEPEPIPPLYAAALKRQIGAPWRRPQRLPVPETRLWLLPVGGKLCLADLGMADQTGVVCTSRGQEKKHALYMATVTPARSGGQPASTFVVGVVPDGNPQVLIMDSQARSHVVSVRHNIFVYRERAAVFPEEVRYVHNALSRPHVKPPRR
jgi:hypothetical protein